MPPRRQLVRDTYTEDEDEGEGEGEGEGELESRDENLRPQGYSKAHYYLKE
jgi:hypothetical protein